MLVLKIPYKVRLKGVDREDFSMPHIQLISEYLGLTICDYCSTLVCKLSLTSRRWPRSKLYPNLTDALTGIKAGFYSRATPPCVFERAWSGYQRSRVLTLSTEPERPDPER